MDYTFIEIGTSNFETLIQNCREQDVGISVEPLEFYLNDLPNKPNVKKLNAAITHQKTSDFIDIYFIPPHIVDLYKLPQWFKGCNTIGKYHPLHVLHKVQQFVEIRRVPLLNVDEFLTNEHVHGIQFLKIDTEGHDYVIMNGLFEYLTKKDNSYYPRRIQFETNEHTLASNVDAVIEKFKSLGYFVVHRGYDTLLQYL